MRPRGRHFLAPSMSGKVNDVLPRAVWFVLVAILSACFGCEPNPSAPDLSDCTRIEIRWDPSLFAYFFRGIDAKRLVSPAERDYLESTNVSILDDPGRIHVFAEKVSEGRFNGRAGGLTRKVAWSLPGPPFVRIVCYRDEERVASLTLSGMGMEMVTEDRRRFAYRAVWDYWEVIEPPENRGFKLRASCADNLQTLWYGSPLDRRDVSSYPRPDDWCDAVVRSFRRHHVIDKNGVKRRYRSDRQIAGLFLCPSVRDTAREAGVRDDVGQSNASAYEAPGFVSHYAMNPDCRPSSEGDMVLLFEAEAGWNQHGGPELFTFGNHDRKGGLVLLNDGTVRFIRTEEELKQLRWK